jgi:hypothetical protein
VKQVGGDAPAGPGSCEATAAKLVELSVAEGKASGREWSVEKQGQKRDQFVSRCREELPAGKVTREDAAVRRGGDGALAGAGLLAGGAWRWRVSAAVRRGGDGAARRRRRVCWRRLALGG